MVREGFVYYRSFYEATKFLPPEDYKKVNEAIIEYGLLGAEPTGLTTLSNAVFQLVKPQIDANNKRYANGCKGGAPKGNQNAKKTTKNNQKQPNST